MASEIKVTAALEAIKGNFRFPRLGGSFVIDMDGDGGGLPGMVEVGATARWVSLAGLDRPGWLFMQNIHASNYVDWGFGVIGSETGTGTTGSDNAGLGGRMEAGEPALFRAHPAIELYMRASGEGTRVLIAVLED